MKREETGPSGLSAHAKVRLEGFYAEAEGVIYGDLLSRTRGHLAAMEGLVRSHPDINLERARQIVSVFEAAGERAAALSDSQVRWLIAAMMYFLEWEDEEHDFESEAGFDDDAEVLNSCLALCGLDALSLELS